MPDAYQTLNAPCTVEIQKIKGSRFIGLAQPVHTEAEVQDALDTLQKAYHNASHHCYAYRLGPEGDRYRAADAGEPSGSAGLPILRQIEARALTCCLVVVVRYYGGTKLGVGGLIRAYGEAAAAVLDAANVITRVQRIHVRLRFAYADTSPALHTLHQFDAPILETHYGEDTELVVGARPSEVDALSAAFTEALHGRGEVAVG